MAICSLDNCTKEATSPIIDPNWCKEHYFETEEWKQRNIEMSDKAATSSLYKYAMKREKKSYD